MAHELKRLLRHTRAVRPPRRPIPPNPARPLTRRYGTIVMIVCRDSFVRLWDSQPLLTSRCTRHDGKPGRTSVRAANYTK